MVKNLIIALALAHKNFTKSIKVQGYVSEYIHGTALMQEKCIENRDIFTYASKTLIMCKKKYSLIEKRL